MYFKVENICVSNAPSHKAQFFYSTYSAKYRSGRCFHHKNNISMDLGECQISITNNKEIITILFQIKSGKLKFTHQGINCDLTQKPSGNL